MTTRLVALVSAEIDAIKARRLDGASADWDEKERLAHAWRLEVRIHQGQSLGAGGAWRPPARLQLRDAARELEDTLEAHARTLGGHERR